MKHKQTKCIYMEGECYIDDLIIDIIKLFWEYGGRSAQSCQGGILNCDYSDDILSVPYHFDNNIPKEYSWCIIEDDDLKLLFKILKKFKCNHITFIPNSNGYCVSEFNYSLEKPVFVMWSM